MCNKYAHISFFIVDNHDFTVFYSHLFNNCHVCNLNTLNPLIENAKIIKLITVIIESINHFF